MGPRPCSNRLLLAMLGVVGSMLLAAPAAWAGGGWQPPETASPSTRVGGNSAGLDALGNALGSWTAFDGPTRVNAAVRPPSGPWGSEHTNVLATFPPQTTTGSGTAVDAAGNAAIVGTRQDNIVVAVLATTGGSFSPAAAISDAGVNATGPSVAINYESTALTVGTAVAVWSRSDGSEIEASTRPPGGSFGAPVQVSAAGASGTQDARVAVDLAGDTIVVWRQSSIIGMRVVASVRPVGGSFGAPQTLSPGGHDAFTPGLAIDDAGDAVAVWQTSDGTNRIVQASQLSAGGSFGPAVTLSAPGSDATGPAVGMAVGGAEVVAWTQGGNVTESDAQAGGAFGSPQVVSGPDGGGEPAVAVMNQRAFIVYRVNLQPSNTPVAMATVRGTSGIWQAPVQISTSSDLDVSSPHVAEDPSGDAIATWDAIVGSSFTVQSAYYAGDSTPPTTLIDTHPANPTNQTSATFTFHATDPDDTTGFTFECQLDGGGFTPCTSPQTYTGLADGSHTFTVEAIDPSGNVDPSPPSFTWTVDTVAPTASITTPAAGQRLTLDANVPASFSCQDNVGGSGIGPGGCAVTVDGVPYSGSTVPTSVLGNHVFTVTPTDRAGNVGTPVSHAYAVDPPRYQTLVSADNPLGYWRLGEPVGSMTMVDYTGQHSGTYQNFVALGFDGAPNCGVAARATGGCNANSDNSVDDPNTAAQFQGTGAHGYVNGLTAPTAQFSMEAWAKPRTSANMMVIEQGGGGAIWILGGHFVFRESPLVGPITGGPSVTPGQWYQVAGTWDGGTQRLYVNGAVVASGAAGRGPSGTSTLYVGYGDQAPWFHGLLDEVAYYPTSLAADEIADHYEVATYTQPSAVSQANTDPSLDTTKPSVTIQTPADGATYQPAKVPNASYSCSDPDGGVDVPSCVGSVANGAPLDSSLGTHSITVTATDRNGNTRTVTHSYTIEPFSSIIGADSPLAYWRLGDADSSMTMVDASPNHHSGTYVNDQRQGPPGPTGDGDTSRQFLGHGGYGYANGITAPEWQWSLEIWVNPDDTSDMMLIQANDVGALYIHNGRFVFRQSDTDVTAPFGPTAHQWYDVVGTWDGIDAHLYVNGVLVAQAEAPEHPNGSGSTVYVGYGDLAPWGRGYLDEAAYFPTALSDERVYEHFLADPPASFAYPGSRGGTTTAPSGGPTPGVPSPPVSTPGFGLSSHPGGPATTPGKKKPPAHKQTHKKKHKHKKKHR